MTIVFPATARSDPDDGGAVDATVCGVAVDDDAGGGRLVVGAALVALGRVVEETWGRVVVVAARDATLLDAARVGAEARRDPNP